MATEQELLDEIRRRTGAPETREQEVASEIDRRSEADLGLDPDIVKRGTILPIGRTREGELELAVPQLAIDVARGALDTISRIRPGMSESEITNAVSLFGIPISRALGATKSIVKPGKLTKEQIRTAPTSQEIAAGSGELFKQSRQVGSKLKPDDYVNFLSNAERTIISEGADPALHPKLTAVFNNMSKRVGDSLDAKDLHNVRRTIGIATESLEPDEARIARLLRDNFDDFVENLPGTDTWVKARNQYIKARKAETVETIIEKAGRQSSGIENGLRIGFRSLLNDKRKLRNFTKEERAAMQAVVDGDFTRNSLKKIGRLSFGTGAQSGFLGGSIGVGTGATLFGPLGAVAAPAIGLGAQKLAERGTRNAAEVVRALASGARPEVKTVFRGTQDVPRTGAAALLSQEDNPQ